jgi:hypothetical protein
MKFQYNTSFGGLCQMLREILYCQFIITFLFSSTLVKLVHEALKFRFGHFNSRSLIKGYAQYYC